MDSIQKAEISYRQQDLLWFIGKIVKDALKSYRDRYENDSSHYPLYLTVGQMELFNNIEGLKEVSHLLEEFADDFYRKANDEKRGQRERNYYMKQAGRNNLLHNLIDEL